MDPPPLQNGDYIELAPLSRPSVTAESIIKNIDAFNISLESIRKFKYKGNMTLDAENNFINSDNGESVNVESIIDFGKNLEKASSELRTFINETTNGVDFRSAFWRLVTLNEMLEDAFGAVNNTEFAIGALRKTYKFWEPSLYFALSDITNQITQELKEIRKILWDAFEKNGLDALVERKTAIDFIRDIMPTIVTLQRIPNESKMIYIGGHFSVGTSSNQSMQIGEIRQITLVLENMLIYLMDVFYRHKDDPFLTYIEFENGGNLFDILKQLKKTLYNNYSSREEEFFELRHTLESALFLRSKISSMFHAMHSKESADIWPEYLLTREMWNAEETAYGKLPNVPQDLGKLFRFGTEQFCIGLSESLGLSAHHNAIPIKDGKNIILGALPKKEHLDAIKALGVTHVLSLNEDYAVEGTVSFKEWENVGIVQMKMPLPKNEVKFRDIRRILAYMHHIIKNGGTIFIHCDSGLGRSPLIVMCYLMLFEDYDIEKVQAYVKSHRPQVDIANSTKLESLKNFQKSLHILKKVRDEYDRK